MMMHAGAAAAAAAGGGGASAMWLFSYNKDNYGFDSGMRFGRFMMARGNANAQVEQYREDIEGIVGTTTGKTGAWQTVTTLFLAVGAALSCAGRVGMHGCAPPGWFCALFSGSIFMSVMFNGLSLWLSMHASLRAQAASVSLLTRQVRLPIPSLGQMDQARVFGSSFENQSKRDIFRIPFMRHTESAPKMPGDDAPAKAKGKKKELAVRLPHDPQKEFASTTRDTVPGWIRDEAVVDKGNGAVGDGTAVEKDPLEAPNHFKLLMESQKEWRDYDVYSRISMLYGVVSFLYAVTYYAVGTTISELRGFWVMWTLPLVFMTAQALILRLDVLHTGQHRLPKVEFFGHAAPLFAVAACTLEYNYYYREYMVGITWGLALLAIFAHFMMALRMLDLACPDDSVVQDMPEEPGRQWWPSSWKVPRAFTKHLWFITPPTKLNPSVSPCLLHEMEDMAQNGGGITYRRRAVKKAPAPADPYAKTETPERTELGFRRGDDLPWRLTRIAILTAALQWFFIIITTGAEVILGPESLLKPPGEPPWIRDTKYRHFTPGMIHMSTSGALPSGYRLFSASTAWYDDDEEETAEDTHTETETETESTTDTSHSAHSAHRRLSKRKNGTDAALGELLKLIPTLGSLADEVHASARAQEAPEVFQLPALPTSFMAAGNAKQAKLNNLKWPALFEPRHMCVHKMADGGSVAMAVSSHGVAGIVLMEGEEARVVPYTLDGLTFHGRIVGLGSTEERLLVVMSDGALMGCDEEVEGRFTCSVRSSLRLPAGARLLSAAVAVQEKEVVIAAITSESPKAVSLYKGLRAEGASFHAAGEIHLPPSVQGPTLTFTEDAQELVISSSSGEVFTRHLHAKTMKRTSAPSAFKARSGDFEFRAACDLGGEEGLLHLALKKSNGAWVPELLLA
mmetsp:Transcript_33008/g.70821  ORF Transcript_33008/g.70821 Transcript_33008/m.70821 type:complete len:908 (-) Transcript_33008:397-3120(-)